ncbi:hypothetical protein, partial [Nonomuraea candida]|uniref:hypothetical protein n=1 Tax=Nonomuraea candida TaxID=359159 RepID=UPI001B806F39
LVVVPESKVRSLLAALLTSWGQTVSADRLVDEREGLRMAETWGCGPTPRRAGPDSAGSPC